jgi:hypothetical protein
VNYDRTTCFFFAHTAEEYVQPISEYAGKVPALPPVRTIEPDTYIGPTEESNWVLM